VQTRKSNPLKQVQRLAQIERFILLGLSVDEMAERLEVTKKTIQRDLHVRMDEWANDIERSTAAYRQSILSELGRLYAEMAADTKTARANGDPTYQYGHARIEILRVVGKITGAEAPVKIDISGKVENLVRLVPESELLRIVERTAIVDAQIMEEAA
jgi:hypothetical protein